MNAGLVIVKAAVPFWGRGVGVGGVWGADCCAGSGSCMVVPPEHAQEAVSTSNENASPAIIIILVPVHLSGVSSAPP